MLDRIARLARRLLRGDAQAPGRIGQLGQHGDRVVANERECADDHAAQCREDENRADDAMDMPSLERAHDGLQRIGEQDSRRQRHEKGLRPFRDGNRRQRGQDYERDIGRRRPARLGASGGPHRDSGIAGTPSARDAARAARLF